MSQQLKSPLEEDCEIMAKIQIRLFRIDEVGLGREGARSKTKSCIHRPNYSGGSVTQSVIILTVKNTYCTISPFFDRDRRQRKSPIWTNDVSADCSVWSTSGPKILKNVLVDNASNARSN